jgi:hypothetical protein
VEALHDPQSAIGVGAATDADLILQMNAVLYFGGQWYARATGRQEYAAPQPTPRAAMLAALEVSK